MNRPLTPEDEANIAEFLNMSRDTQTNLLKEFIEWGYSDDLAGDFETALQEHRE